MRSSFIYLLVLLLVSSGSQARTISDIDLAEEIRMDAGGPALNLNGAALRRTHMIIRTYVGGLYLENPTSNETRIIESDQHKRMLFHVLLKRVTARKIARALREALVVNITREEQARLEPQIKQFLSIFKGKLHKNDEVSIDYIPGLGTKVSIAGVEKGVIPGKRFSDALLSMWVGNEPVSDSFKNNILGIY
ncbi:MAG: hypothetical protein CSB48_13395 [Proteobacteria bacterium]|nr:MAG: hypothetical protein CSB48_13395 [Pseudomonadota bacterium]